MAVEISSGEVSRIASLARLRLSDEDRERYRRELREILDHASRLAELDLEGVQPLPRPEASGNIFAEDCETVSMPRDQIARIAPVMEGQFLAVPKVFGGAAQR